MSNQMPIYSQVVPKSQYKKSSSKSKEQKAQSGRGEFDPLNYNHGGNFHLMNPGEGKNVEKGGTDRRESRRVKEERQKRTQNARTEASEGKVEAYLRQNQANMQKQQHRHSAVRQAEHRVNLRCLPLNDVATSLGHDRTPDKHRNFEKESREHRRGRDRDLDDDEALVQAILSPITSHSHRKEEKESNHRSVRKSSSSHRVTETAISSEKRKFFCREWAFQKVAHCLEQRPVSKTCGALILGDRGSGKTALCQELSEPGQGPQARQQRALNRRLLARHFLQGNSESSLRPGDFIRSVVMQILSHSSQHRQQKSTPVSAKEIESPYSKRDDQHTEFDIRYNMAPDTCDKPFVDGPDDGEDSCKPLLDSEDQRTDEEDLCARRGRTIDRIHEKLDYVDSLCEDAALTNVQLPQILPRSEPKTNNPFLTDNEDATRVYENHENLFLRNISQRQSKEIRSSRLQRQNSEPLTEGRKIKNVQKSISIDQKTDSASSENEKDQKDKRTDVSSSPPSAKVSRIPVANFRYPNKSDLRSSSVENSPHKSKPTSDPEKDENNDPKVVDLPTENNEELPEYQNVIKPKYLALNFEKNNENFGDFDEVPPPIPSLPISARTLIANAYYEKLLSDQDIQQALLPQNLEKNPDECFKKALLFPLLEIDPPKQCLFLLVDSIDEGSLTKEKEEVRNINISRTIAELLGNHHHLFPQWLLLVCTARRHSKILTKMFTGFRKITIDELQRAHVSADVQRYVLARLDTENRLRSRVSSDSAQAAAAALDYLRIKSDGCMLYLEKVLDGIADGFIALREIKEIPGTLNGLYLWLAQRLFHGRRFTKVRLLLDVLLAARCGVTEEMLYKCLLTKEYSVTREDFNRRLHLLRRVLIMEQSTGFLSIFHHSFASWLLDVKHCTRRYLCSPQDGHAALAMYYTLEAKRLTALEIHNYVLHMTQLEQHIAAQKKTKNDSTQNSEPLNVHTLMLLWVLDSGCDIESALKKDSCTLMQLEEKVKECIIEEPESVMEESDIVMKELKTPDDQTSGVMPDFMAGIENARWPRDARVLRALLELSRVDTLSDDEKNKVAEENGVINEIISTSLEEKKEDDPDKEEKLDLDPASIHDIVARGDEDALELLLKHCPTSVQLVDASGSSALSAAARAGRTNLVRMLLQASMHDRWTPLRAAAAAGQTEVVEVLLEYGCDVDGVDADNRTALRTAAWSGHEAVVSQLLAAGANPDLPDGEGRTPLIAAAYMGHAEIVRALLDAGADVNHADEDGRTALSVSALCATGTQCAALLLERGADVSLADRDQYTPLLVAAFEGHTETCELLLEHGASIEATCRSGRTALWAAASASRPQTLRLLLYWGAGVDDVDSRGRTVLSSAAAAGNVEVVRQLLDRGLDEHHRDNSGWMPLHYAAFEGHIEVCEALLEAGAKVDEPDNDGKGPLMLCAQEGHVKLIEMLIDDWGAPVDQKAHDGKTALRLAALEGHLECVFALYERGADVDALDADRRSTLYVLALDNRLAMAKYLMRECNASVHTRDAEGRTPLHVSAWQGHTEMVNLLVKLGNAEIDSCDRCARTALHAAAWRGRAGVLRALLDLGAARDPLCAQGATPLGIAAQEGHEDCVLYLLQYGADPLQTDHCGRTPASVAWRAGHHNICRLLDAAQRDDVRHLTPRSPSYKRRSVHSNSTKSSSNLTGGSGISHDATAAVEDVLPSTEKPNKANLSLSFAQQIARRGRSSRRDRDSDIPEHDVLEREKLRSYSAGGMSRDCQSPLYASPPSSPPDVASPLAEIAGSQPPSLSAVQPAITDQHFNRDTHMRIILGRESKPLHERNDSKNKRNGIVTNPAMRLVANVRNGLDNAAANIRRTGVALAASASSANPAVKTNAFQWRKETPL